MSTTDLSKHFEAKPQYPEHYEAVSQHLSQFFEGCEITVFHEMVSMDFHLDVYFVKGGERGYNVLLTSGMSSMPMEVSEGIAERDNYRFAELMMLVPSDITFSQVTPGNTLGDALVQILKQTARFPHYANTFIAPGHTLQAHDESLPYEGTNLYGVLLHDPLTFGHDFSVIETSNGVINIYTILPLYKSELEFKIQNGFSKFADRLIHSDLQEVFDPERENLCPEEKKSWMSNLFG